MPERKHLFVEAKSVPGPALARALDPLFRANPRFVSEREIFLISFYPDVLWPIAARFPDLTLMLLLDNLQRLPRRLPSRLPDDTLPVHGLGFSHQLDLDPERRRQLIDAGAILAVWTENDPARAAHWEQAGFDFLFTDYPERFIPQG